MQQAIDQTVQKDRYVNGRQQQRNHNALLLARRRFRRQGLPCPS